MINHQAIFKVIGKSVFWGKRVRGAGPRHAGSGITGRGTGGGEQNLICDIQEVHEPHTREGNDTEQGEHGEQFRIK